jgi:saccharopine dehydrogenase-like NADP-dependent oxidoreductase
MIEKTLRYPGSIEYIKSLRESGFLSQQEVDINGIMVKPIDMTSKLLKPLWKLKKGEKDFTIMRSKIMGTEDNQNVGYQYLIYDKYDPKTGLHSMSRTTAFTCSAVVDLFMDKSFTKHGIITPEEIASIDGLFAKVISYLKNRGVDISVSRLY